MLRGQLIGKSMKKIFIPLLLLIATITGLYFFHPQTPKSDKPIVTPVSFNDLPNWGGKSFKQSFQVFRNSCAVFIKQDPNKSLDTEIINLSVKDMLPACKKALSQKKITSKQAANFFKTWFQPIEVKQPDNSPTGLFTGYYAPLLSGSLKKTDKYTVPIYTLPKSLIRLDLSKFDANLDKKTLVGRIQNNEFLPYHDREAINKGALKHVPVLVWVENRVDRLFLEIQGSGIIQFDNGKRMYVGYAGQNGQPYTALAGVLIREGVMTKDNASMQAIRRYFEEHPENIDGYLNQNQSFVFFKDLKQKAALGAQGIALTAGYSLAVDRRYVPMGLPVWLSTSYPDNVNDHHQPFHRLMIAQDTGGAIKGPIRGDVYWGAGEKATYTAGHMKNPGRWWLLIPKQRWSEQPKPSH